jgi:hypothetical protein
VDGRKLAFDKLFKEELLHILSIVLGIFQCEFFIPCSFFQMQLQVIRFQRNKDAFEPILNRTGAVSFFMLPILFDSCEDGGLQPWQVEAKSVL